MELNLKVIMLKTLIYTFFFISLIACNSKHTSEIKQDSIKYFVSEIKKLSAEPTDSMLGVNFYNLSDSVKTVKLNEKFRRLKGKYSLEQKLSVFLNEKPYSSKDSSLFNTYRLLYYYGGGSLDFQIYSIKLILSNKKSKLEINKLDAEGNKRPFKFKLLASKVKYLSSIESKKIRELIHFSEIENLTHKDIESENLMCCFCSSFILETIITEDPYQTKYINIGRYNNNKQNNFNIACNYLLDLAEVKNRY